MLVFTTFPRAGSSDVLTLLSHSKEMFLLDRNGTVSPVLSKPDCELRAGNRAIKEYLTSSYGPICKCFFEGSITLEIIRVVGVTASQWDFVSMLLKVQTIYLKYLRSRLKVWRVI